MSKFKVGDEVVLVVSKENPIVLKKGVTGVVLENDNVPYVQFNVEKSDELHNGWGLGEDGKCWSVRESEIELLKPKTSQSFKNSNRYKLHKYISSTGFSKLDLSRALNKGDSFLSVETRESQFTNRGDMSDARYKSLRKQIKGVVDAAKTLNDKTGSEVFNKVCSKNAESFVEDFDKGFDDLKEKINVADIKINIDEKEVVPMLIDEKNYDVDEKVQEAKQALGTFHCKPKPSNNGVLILALVFFVMLVIFILGCFIYKAT